MAGHSHFANIKYKKEANDAKKTKIYTKLAREITIAAKSGLPDPEFNSKLKIAITKAKSGNLPKDRIENAIKQASNVHENSEKITYNAFMEHGIGVVIECYTNNKNRTASNISIHITIQTPTDNICVSDSFYFIKRRKF